MGTEYSGAPSVLLLQASVSPSMMALLTRYLLIWWNSLTKRKDSLWIRQKVYLNVFKRQAEACCSRPGALWEFDADVWGIKTNRMLTLWAVKKNVYWISPPFISFCRLTTLTASHRCSEAMGCMTEGQSTCSSISDFRPSAVQLATIQPLWKKRFLKVSV